MNGTILKLEFDGRRKLDSSRKKTYYIMGAVTLVAGLFGLLRNSEFNTFFLILTTGGIFNLLYGLFGKKLIKEKNYISINPEKIEYKNSFKKPCNIKLNDLLDLRIESAKVELVMNDQRVQSYDFSVFQGEESEKILRELKKLKVKLIE